MFFFIDILSGGQDLFVRENIFHDNLSVTLCLYVI